MFAHWAPPPVKPLLKGRGQGQVTYFKFMWTESYFWNG